MIDCKLRMEFLHLKILVSFVPLEHSFRYYCLARFLTDQYLNAKFLGVSGENRSIWGPTVAVWGAPGTLRGLADLQ